MSGGAADKAHEAHLAEVESRHPKFGAFLRHQTADPKVREAYYAAMRRSEEEDRADDAAERRRLLGRGRATADAGVEGPMGGASSEAGLEVAAGPASSMGRAWLGLSAPLETGGDT